MQWRHEVNERNRRLKFPWKKTISCGYQRGEESAQVIWEGHKAAVPEVEDTE